MDRALDPVYLQARAALETILAHAGYQLASECHHPDAFGSAEAEYRGRNERLRLTWDGKDRWLGLAAAPSRGSSYHPGPSDWRPLEPKQTTAPSQFLRLGAVTDQRVAQLEEALRQHLSAAI